MVNQYPTERLCTNLQSISSSTNPTVVQPRVVDTTEDHHAADFCRRNACEGGDRSSQSSIFPGVLLPRVSCHQEKWKVQTSHQSSNPQPNARGSHIQDGNSSLHIVSSSSGRLGHLHRPYGRVLPYTNSKMVPEVPPFRNQQQGLPIPSSSLRFGDGTSHIHQDAGTDGYSSSLTRHLPSQVHRRHPSQSYDSRTTDHLGHDRHQDSTGHGLPHQPSKVNVGSDSRLRLHRGALHHSPRADETPRRQDIQDPIVDSTNQRRRPCSSQNLALSSGSIRLCRKTSSAGPSTHPPTSDVSSLSVSLGSTSVRVPSSSQQQVLDSTGVVVQYSEYIPRTTSRTILSGSHSVHGCINEQLGSSCQRPPVLRRLDQLRETSVDQSARTTSCDPSHSSSSTIVKQLENHDSIGQLHDHLVHQQDGGHSKQTIAGTDPRIVSISPVEERSPPGQTHSGSSQQTRRHSIENPSNSGHRVDTVDVSLQTSFVSMGISDSRPDGYITNDTSSSLRIAIPRPESASDRRNILRMDGSGRIHISTMAYDRTCSSETQTQSLHCDGNHPMLAEPTLVSGSTRPAGRISKKTPSTSRSTDHASQPPSARKRRSTFSARMQTIIETSLDQGFSSTASERIARGRHANSTQVIYDSKWLKFENWCISREIDPSMASLGQLADFLLHLFNELKLGYSTITGYRSSINSVWRSTGRQDVESHAIHQLLDSFKVDRPRSVIVLPKWDLALVLRVLSQPPYEPIESIDFKNLSAKTVFLLLLATSRRKGDIHAIDPNRITVTRSGVILETLPGYIPKVRANAEREARYLPMVVRKLSSITNDSSELTLCPVRALQQYHQIAKEKAPNRPQFFISTRGNKRAVTKNTISAWVVKLIRSAYSSASSEDCRLSQTSVHEVRAIATSLAYQATYALDDVLKAATWATPTTFIDHYLREVTGLQGRIHVIAPCVVAGKTLR